MDEYLPTYLSSTVRRRVHVHVQVRILECDGCPEPGVTPYQSTRHWSLVRNGREILFKC